MIADGIALSDEFVGSFGGSGICYESGQADDTSSVNEIFSRIIHLLSVETGVMDSKIQSIKGTSHHEFYEIESVSFPF